MDDQTRQPSGPGPTEEPRRPPPAGYGVPAASDRAAPGASSSPGGPGSSADASRAGTVYGRVTRFGDTGPGGSPTTGPSAGAGAPTPAAGGWPPPGAVDPYGRPVAPAFAGTGPAPTWGPPAAGPGPGVPAAGGGPGPGLSQPPPWAFQAPWAPPAPRPSWRPEEYAPWLRRVGGLAIDNAPSYVASVLLLVSYVPLYAGLLRGDLTAQPTWWLVLVAILLSLAATGWSVYNRWYVAGSTGQSVGKRVMGTWLVSAVDGRPVGMLNAFLRDLLHVVDGVAYVGYLWPLWDERRQTLSDKLIDTVVVRTPVAPLTDAERGHRP